MIGIVDVEVLLREEDLIFSLKCLPRQELIKLIKKLDSSINEFNFSEEMCIYFIDAARQLKFQKKLEKIK